MAIKFYDSLNVTSTADSYFLGNVGIGTTSPTEKLEVVGNVILDASNARLKIKGGITGTNSGIDWTFSSDSTQYAKIELDYDDRATTGLLIDSGYPLTLDYSSSRFAVQYNGVEQMRVNTDGNVGIGTTSPNAKLDVRGVPPSGTGTILNVGFDASNPTRAKIHSEGYSGAFSLYDSGGTEDVKITTNGNSWFNGGNVGIGTSSPDRQLEIESSDVGAVAISGVNGSKLYFRPNNSYSVGGNFGIETTGLTSGTYESTMKFTGFNSSVTTPMTIKGSGNVGIGTTSPQGDLHVVGATGNAGRIYVSDKDTGTASTDSALFMQSGANTFLYNRSSGSLKLGTNDDSTMFTITNSGNVGIGIATPNTKLQISGGGFNMFADGGTNADQFLVVTHQYAFSDENEDAVYSYDSIGGHEFSTGGSPKFKIFQNGNVEINNNVTANSFIKDGGASTQYLMADGSVSTSSGGSSPWTADTNGITYTAGTVGIGMASVSGIDLSVNGPAKFDGAVRIVGNTRIDGAVQAVDTVEINGDTTIYSDVIIKEDLRLARDIYDVQELTGTTGQVLVSKGVGNGVEWETPSGGGGAQLLSYNFSGTHTNNSTGSYYQFRNQSNSTMYSRLATFTSWGGSYYVDLTAPDDCFLKSFTIRSRNSSTWSSGLQLKMRIHKNKTIREYDGSFVTSTGSGENGKITFDLTSSDTSFSQGDAVAIGFNCTGAMGYVTAMAIFELT